MQAAQVRPTTNLRPMIGVLFGLILVLSGCKSEDAATSGQLSDNTLQDTHQEETVDMQTVEPLNGTYEDENGGRISFTNEGRFSARMGCNIINGAFVQDGAKISFTPPFISTRMACEASLMQRDAELYSFLEEVRELEGIGNTITLRSSGGELVLRQVDEQ